MSVGRRLPFAAGFRRRLDLFRATRTGSAAIEFALITPVLILIFVGMTDFGLVLYTRFQLNETVSASANYALVNAASVTAAGSSGLASNMAAIMPTSINTTIVINNGHTLTRTNGTPSTSGTAGNAALCYCPTRTGATITWGPSVTCGNSCTGGTLAGKFVHMTASTPHTPLFSNYGLVQNGVVSTSTTVQVQ